MSPGHPIILDWLYYSIMLHVHYNKKKIFSEYYGLPREQNQYGCCIGKRVHSWDTLQNRAQNYIIRKPSHRSTQSNFVCPVIPHTLAPPMPCSTLTAEFSDPLIPQEMLIFDSGCEWSWKINVVRGEEGVRACRIRFCVNVPRLMITIVMHGTQEKEMQGFFFWNEVRARSARKGMSVRHRIVILQCKITK